MKHLSPPFHFCIIYNCTNNTPTLTQLIFAFQRQQMHLIFHSNPNFRKDDICFCTSCDLESTLECPQGAVTLLRPHARGPCRAPLLHPTALDLKNLNKQPEKDPKAEKLAIQTETMFLMMEALHKCCINPVRVSHNSIFGNSMWKSLKQ